VEHRARNSVLRRLVVSLLFKWAVAGETDLMRFFCFMSYDSIWFLKVIWSC